ncbi:MAG: hypothetical protein ACI81R_003381 [Bradymonadia bacterium]|jgi:hypothetical protein
MTPLARLEARPRFDHYARLCLSSLFIRSRQRKTGIHRPGLTSAPFALVLSTSAAAGRDERENRY